VSVFAQGTVTLDNRTAAGTTHVWGPGTVSTLSLVGAGLNDNPAGTVDYAGAGMKLIGSTGGLTAATTFAQLLAANGAGVAEASLTPQGATTTFRTGGAAGNLAGGKTISLANVPADSAVATLELVAWDNTSGLYPTWTETSVAWAAGLIAAGKSGAFDVSAIGGSVNTSPNLYIPSFNMYMIGSVPEPSTFALAGLGLAAMLVLRRRK